MGSQVCVCVCVSARNSVRMNEILCVCVSTRRGIIVEGPASSGRVGAVQQSVFGLIRAPLFCNKSLLHNLRYKDVLHLINTPN